MASDDELRRVAEDVRALARSLGRDIRAALDRAREDTYGAVKGPSSAGTESGGDPVPVRGRRSAREDLAGARQELRQAQLAVRQSVRRYRHGGRGYGDGDGYGNGEGRAFGDGGVEDDEGRRRGWCGAGPPPGCPPRWDNWGRHRYRTPAGVRPGRRAWASRPHGPAPPSLASEDRAPAPLPVPVPPLRHRHDGTTLLGLLAVVFGLAWLAAGTHLAQFPTEGVVAVALMVVGAATVVTARTDWALSRRSWPLLAGAGLALALLGLSASPGLPVGFQHLNVGSRTIAPATWAGVPARVHGGFGKTVVDLAALPSPLPADRTLMVDSAAGRLEIDVAANVAVVVDARVSAGRIDIDGVVTSGLDRAVHQVIHPTATGPVLTLHVDSGFGSVAITTSSLDQPKPPLQPTVSLPPNLLAPGSPR